MTRLYQPLTSWVVWTEQKLWFRGVRMVFDCAICGDHMRARVWRHRAEDTKRKVIRAFQEVHRHPDQQDDPASWVKRAVHPSWTPEAERRFDRGLHVAGS